jgi:putative YhdH/YhfP family quinone oxidoreductase
MEPAMPQSFPAYVVRKNESGRISAATETISREELPPGEVLIRVVFSSLNYKDAMACQGHPGVVGAFPHVPGIDCAGVVEESTTHSVSPGDEVLVTGYGLGSARWGGYAGFVRVPAEWVVPLPSDVTTEETMVYGTAGFTAAQSVTAIVEHRIEPANGDVVVSGASGGVGSFAVAILAQLGFRVIAATGKRHATDFLKQLGAAEVIRREDLIVTKSQPLLAARWAAAVDTVGGETLASILRSTKHRGCVTACGLVGGANLDITVYPFILRGVTLAGIDSAKCPQDRRLAMWKKLAGEWKVPALLTMAKTVTLDRLPAAVDAILAGEIIGRTLVRPTTSA